MPEKEPNNFKLALADARTVANDARTALDGANGMSHAVTARIATREGWVCDAADEWIADLTGKCPAVMGEFDTAWSELNAAYQGETEDEVDEGDWRGLSYISSISYGRPGGNIPI